MTLSDIANSRLHSQQIAGTKLKTPKEVLACMGAMQAQDYQMAKWAIGVRLPGSTDKLIETAIDKGEIIRTHLLRPTWHLVSADDIYWMLELTAPHIRSAMKAFAKDLGLTDKVVLRCLKIIEKALSDGKHLTREELMGMLNKAKISTESFRSTHIMFHAEINGIVCNGARNGKNNTYALLAERAPKKKTFAREEALAMLAQRYFSSHGPATISDFRWWSGLPANDARAALEMVKSKFISEKIGEEIYWFSDSFPISKNDKSSVYLLPAFDEFLISYKDRSASFPHGNHKMAFTSNGIFRPVIVIDGHVTGIWKRTIKNEKVSIETELFRKHSKVEITAINKSAAGFATFLNKKAEMTKTSIS